MIAIVRSGKVSGIVSRRIVELKLQIHIEAASYRIESHTGSVFGISYRIVSYRTTSHNYIALPALHRIGLIPHRNGPIQHRIASYHITSASKSYRIVSYRIAWHRIAAVANQIVSYHIDRSRTGLFSTDFDWKPQL